MKIDDVTNLLANTINQPHYVKDWLEKFYNKGFQDSKKLTPYSENDMRSVAENYNKDELFDNWLKEFNEQF